MLTIHLLHSTHPRLVRLGALLAVAVCTAVVPALVSPPNADAVDCGVRKLCLYSGVDWTGRVITISERELRRGNITNPLPGADGVTLIDPRIKGRISSWINTTTLKLCGLLSASEAFTPNDEDLRPSDEDEILWTGSRFTRDPYVGNKANNETDFISTHC
jgi:Peptidase inhibitor family I36